MRNGLIARLTSNELLIKGVQMEGWRKVGDPAEFASFMPKMALMNFCLWTWWPACMTATTCMKLLKG